MDSFVPIRFGIKQSVSGKNYLYVVIDNEAIKMADVTAGPLSEKQSTTPTESANISVAKVLSKVNKSTFGEMRYCPCNLAHCGKYFLPLSLPLTAFTA